MLGIIANIVLYAYTILKFWDDFLETLDLNHKFIYILKIVLRFILFTSYIVIGISFNDVSIAFNLLGNIFSVILGFIFPTMIYYGFFSWKLKKSKKYKIFGAMSIGILGGVSGCVMTLKG